MHPLRTLFLAFVLAFACLGLSACVSSNGTVSGYGGPTVSSATAKRTEVRGKVKEAKADVKASKRQIKKLERAIARNERRLKRKSLSQKRKDAAEEAIKDDKKELRTAKRDLRRAERSLASAERAERRADRAIISAKRRQEAAEKRIAAAKKREEQRKARKALERDDAKPNIRDSLFASADPALANVKDYQARIDGGFKVVEIPVKKIDKRLLRQEVAYRTSHRPGTIVVDTSARYLYLVMPRGRAMRYGIGVGRAGFAWSGAAHIGWKREWPKWTPPAEMIKREPRLEPWSAENGGMPGGPTNPLGARALYLMKDGRDTLYRLHGTPQWASIGTAASSGCIRLMNQDIIDLYERVPNGTKVVVL